MPVRQLAEVLTHSEFLDWLGFLDWQEQKRDKMDFYLAQIAAEVRRMLVRQPKHVSVRNFYVSYVDPAAADRMKRSKAAWGAALKMDLN